MDICLPPGRYFLALWPPPPVREAIADASTAWLREAARDCRPVPAARYHLTLHFLGALDIASVGRLQASLDALADWRPAAFRLQLDHPGHFGRKAAWLGCRKPAPALLDLHAGLARSLHAAGLDCPPTPSFVPHVTLARHMRGDWPRVPAGASVGIPWDVREWVLVRSLPQQAHAYRVMLRLPLAEG